MSLPGELQEFFITKQYIPMGKLGIDTKKKDRTLNSLEDRSFPEGY